MSGLLPLGGLYLNQLSLPTSLKEKVIKFPIGNLSINERFQMKTARNSAKASDPASSSQIFFKLALCQKAMGKDLFFCLIKEKLEQYRFTLGFRRSFGFIPRGVLFFFFKLWSVTAHVYDFNQFLP